MIRSSGITDPGPMRPASLTAGRLAGAGGVLADRSFLAAEGH